MLSLNKDHIQRQFDRSANSYDHVAGMQRDIVVDLMALLSGGDESFNGQVLDAGCGTGYGLQELAKYYPQAKLTGLDLAPEMLKIAHTQSGNQSGNAEFLQGDIEALPFADNTFDITWSSSAIQWCDQTRAVDELLRVTKPNGEIAISTFCAGTLDQWRKMWGIGKDDRFVSLNQLKEVFTKAGLVQFSLQEKTYAQRFSSFTSAVNSIRELGAGNAENERAQGLFGVKRYRTIKAKIKQVIERDGCIILPYKVALIRATKKLNMAKQEGGV